MSDQPTAPETESQKWFRLLVESERRLEQNADTRYGRNAGVACDTTSGPCNCGAWH